MKYHELTTTSNRSSRRVGRGIAAGQGKTAGRGTKGQKSRTGSSRKPGFEGGQTPLMQRLPKIGGFRSIRPKAELIYTGQLNEIGSSIDNDSLAKAGLITSPYTKVKLVVKGELTKKVIVKLQSASQNAIKAVEKAGGTFTKMDQQKRAAKPAKTAKP